MNIRVGLILFLMVFTSLVSYAQNFGVVDTDAVLRRMPKYKEAQGELDKLAGEWQGEIDKMFEDVASLRRQYEAEEVLLTPDMKQERQDTILAKETRAREYQKKTFGPNGLYFLKRKELVEPLQNELFEAVQSVCRRKRLNFMFDKSGDIVMLYTDPRHDYTDYVLEELGLGDPNDRIDNPRYRNKK